MTAPGSAFQWHPDTRLLRADPVLGRLCYTVRAGLSLKVAGGQVTGLTTPFPVLLCATSGSSGDPKIIRRTPASWQASFAVNGPVLGLGPSATVAVFAGPESSLALYAVLEAAHHGAAILPLSGLRPDRQDQAIADHGADVLYLTPTQLIQLCDKVSPRHHVRHIMVGGGRLSPAAERAAADAFPGARLIKFYGAAETSFITWTDAATPPGSVGRPYPGVILNLDDDGTIWVCSPYLSDGYDSGDSPHTRWRNGFLTVGEVGHLDPTGHLFLTARAGRTVTVADRNVSLDGVEAALSDLIPAAQIVVLAVPDARRGSRLVALIAGADADAHEDTLRALCRQRLS
ncbi:MAG: AMP-binding protein, partial [Alphaproteobacteria bacterium]|nr:AMP-binding protein [Alphaproteobacteria bacterium]